jgi:hypothetical protein
MPYQYSIQKNIFVYIQANKQLLLCLIYYLTKCDILILIPQQTQSNLKLFVSIMKKAILFQHVTRGISCTHGWWLHIKR